MKVSQIKVISLLTFISALLIFNSFVNKIFSNYGICAFLLCSIGVSIYLFGYKKEKSRYNKDVILSIVIYCIAYYLITYLAGLFIGFNYNIYSLKFLKIIKNIFPVILMIVLSETLRYIINSKFNESKIILILSFITFVLIDTTFTLGSIDYSNFESILTNIGLFVLPSISTNMLLTYMSYKVSYKPCIIYRLIMELPTYMLPIFTAFGNYVWSVIYVAFPLFVFIRIYLMFSAINKKTIIKSNYKSKERVESLLRVVIVSMLFIVIGLTCGFFKYQLIVIASGSMEPIIYRGDAVLVKKLSTEEINDLQTGDIIVFKKDNKIIVHRIYNIIETGNEKFIKTKGDNNKSPDNYLVELSEVVGTTNKVVKYIGYPTVWLSEAIR